MSLKRSWEILSVDSSFLFQFIHFQFIHFHFHFHFHSHSLLFHYFIQIESSNIQLSTEEEEGDGMGSLNLEDYGLDDTTGLAVQICNFEVLLCNCSSFLLNYVHYQLRLILGSSIPIGRHLDDFLKENLCRRNGFFYFCILPSKSCGARTATRYSGDHFERLHDEKKVDGSSKVAPTRFRSIASIYLAFWLNTGGYYSSLLVK